MKYPGIFETERLILRPLTLDDIPHWMPFMQSAEALRYFPGFETKDADQNAVTWIKGQLERYGMGRFGMEALIEKQSGVFVGQCGLLLQTVEDEHYLEIGYSLLPKHWGKGYATEAATFLRNLAFEHALAEEVISLIHPDNTPSQAVAQRNGMKLLRTSFWRGEKVLVFGISRKTFSELH